MAAVPGLAWADGTAPAPAASSALVQEAKVLAGGNRLAPKAFRAAAAQVRPSIVSIETFGGVALGGKSGAGASFQQGEGPTTGLVLTSDGYIVTSTFNFQDRPPVITVVFSNGDRRVAKLLGRDDTRKLCLLKVDGATDLAVPPFTPRDEMRVGQWAVALGVGFGEHEPALSAGIVSALHRAGGRAVQTDANLSPANYGGPLVDIEGRVLGICVPLSPGSKETSAGAEWYDSGIGFAIPLAGLEPIVAQMKEGKTLQAGYLGIQSAPHGDPPAGAEVQKVLPDSAAQKAGLQEGDLVVRVNGEAVLDVAHLSALVNRHLLGDTLELEIQRGEEKKTVPVILGEMPKTPPQAANLEKQDPEQPKPDSEKREEEPQPKPADDSAAG
jgi:serine protease Do